MEALTPEVVDITGMEIIKVESLDPVSLFTGGGIDPILKEIERQVSGLVPDTETDKGRKEIASTAHKVSKSKVLLDGLGKNLVADWKGKAKKVDAVRKPMRDFLDGLRDKVRQPLTEWEAIEKAKEDEKRRLVEFNLDQEDAIAENSLFDREREMDRKEAELKKLEDERLAKIEAERLKKEQAERDERLKKEAAAAAKKEAEDKAAAEKQAILKREADALAETERTARKAKEAKEKAERDRVAAEEAKKREADRVEREKVAAKEKAKKDKADAVEAERVRAKAVSDQINRDRAAKEKAAKEKSDRDAANLNHRKRIDREIMLSLVANSVDKKSFNELIELIANKQIKHVQINY